MYNIILLYYINNYIILLSQKQQMIMSMQGRVMTDDRGISMRMHVSRGATAHIVFRHINIVHNLYIYTHDHKSNITKIVCKNM